MKTIPSIHPEADTCAEPRFFTLKELCYTAQSFDNNPTTFTQVCNLRVLAEFLDIIRLELNYPIYVNSAFRTIRVNNAVKGTPHSLHLFGRAADIWTADNKTEDLIDILRNHRNEMSEFIVNRDKKYIHIAI